MGTKSCEIMLLDSVEKAPNKNTAVAEARCHTLSSIPMGEYPQRPLENCAQSDLTPNAQYAFLKKEGLLCLQEIVAPKAVYV